jgi:large subunit ribosomal protein L7/L12
VQEDESSFIIAKERGTGEPLFAAGCQKVHEIVFAHRCRDFFAQQRSPGKVVAMRENIGRTWTPEVQDLGNQIAALTISKAAELSAYLRKVHKVEAVSKDRIVPPPPPPPPPAEWTVWLDGFDSARKLAVIKVVREIITGLGLKEAKDFVEAAPRPIKANVPTAEAELLRQKLAEAGARVSLKS